MTHKPAASQQDPKGYVGAQLPNTGTSSDAEFMNVLGLTLMLSGAMVATTVRKRKED